jgi:hypothetical protein
MDPSVLLFLLVPSVLRALLLVVVAWLTALCTRSSDHREIARYLICLPLTPPWGRGYETRWDEKVPKPEG